MMKFKVVRTMEWAAETFWVTLTKATLARLKRSISFAKSSSELAQAVDLVDDHDIELAWGMDHSPGARLRCGVGELENHGSYGHE